MIRAPTPGESGENLSIRMKSSPPDDPPFIPREDDPVPEPAAEPAAEPAVEPVAENASSDRSIAPFPEDIPQELAGGSVELLHAGRNRTKARVWLLVKGPRRVVV